MKKILGLAIAGMMVIAMVSGATWAVFSDQEVSTGNTLSTGTLDLNIGTTSGTLGNSAVSTFTASNVKPNDNGTGSSTLKNVGSLSGTLSVATAAVTGTAGTNNLDPDIVPTNSLKDTILLGMYLDLDSSNSWSAGDIGLKSDGSYYNYAAVGADNLALGTATVSSGVITGISFAGHLGSGYQNTTDVISISDSTGSGAMATVAISGGQMGAVTIISGGSGYSGSSTIKVLESNTRLDDVMSAYASKTWGTLVTMADVSHTPNQIKFQTKWTVPSSAGNEIQGGSASVDFTFTLKQ